MTFFQDFRKELSRFWTKPTVTLPKTPVIRRGWTM